MKVYIGPPSEDGETQEVDVQIDDHDLWNFDISIAHIIHPFLVEFRKNYRGAPYVYNMDVWDQNLWETNEQRAHRKKTGEEDPNFFKRWNWVLDEMIWTFEQKARDDWELDYFECEDDPNADGGFRVTRRDEEEMKKHQARMTHGFTLFGKYFENLWI